MIICSFYLPHLLPPSLLSSVCDSSAPPSESAVRPMSISQTFRRISKCHCFCNLFRELGLGVQSQGSYHGNSGSSVIKTNRPLDEKRNDFRREVCLGIKVKQYQQGYLGFRHCVLLVNLQHMVHVGVWISHDELSSLSSLPAINAFVTVFTPDKALPLETPSISVT